MSIDVEMNSVNKSDYILDRESMVAVYDALELKPWRMEFDENGKIKTCIWSDSYRQKMGFENEVDFPNEMDSLLRQIHEDDRERMMDTWRKAIADTKDRTKYDVEYRCFRKDGEMRWFHSVGVVTRRPDGSPYMIIGLSGDITEEKLQNERLREQFEIVEALSHDFLNIFMVNMNDRKVSVVKLDGYVTENFGDKTRQDYPYDPFCLKYIKDRVYPEDQEMLREAMSFERVDIETKRQREYVRSYRVVDNGEVHFYQFSYIRLAGANGNDRVIAGFKNIDAIVESAREREALKVLSETDIMTSVLNRGHGEKLATQAVDSGQPGMLCILDMDDFKQINDTYGHSVGDKVLIGVADCLKKAFRASDIVFRLGGDEFSVVAVGVRRREDADNLITRFFNLVDTLLIPELAGIGVAVSVGAVMFSDNSAKFEQLYREADSCVYESKKIEGSAVTFYEDVMAAKRRTDTAAE
ncbi:MAG: diguanylate cyclase [Lachnospiraceae bacterium]|nr:diguanylate cyclase [Lachnospiraceae bacterium]